jgi:predicted nucleic acid-binding protein
MPAPDFLDTNILLYAYDRSDHRKQLIAREFLRKALAGQMLVSTQVLAEYGVHLYDRMIVAAAERGGCQKILSEDFNAGQKYFGITVENPFRDTR